jgi:hypothetical protein
MLCLIISNFLSYTPLNVRQILDIFKQIIGYFYITNLFWEAVMKLKNNL